MARTARVVAVGYPHHILQRGNLRRAVFRSDEDREAYLDRLLECSEEHRLEVLAYCLLDDRINIVAIPKRENSLSMALRRTHSFYSRWLNAKLRREGHVWQNRYYSCPMETDWAWEAVRYVEQIPVREGIVRRAEKFEWSSAPGHCGLLEDNLISTEWPGRSTKVRDWAKWLREKQDPETIEAIERATSRGQALGSQAFINRLEKKLKRPVGPRRIGRPPKKR